VNPGNDLISHLVQGDYDGVALPDEEILAAVVFLLTAGVETTERVLTSTFRYLALDPEAWEEAASRRDDREALSAFSAEALRMFPPVQGLVRQARADEEVSGIAIARGDRVVPLLASGNRDDDVFPDPQRFEPNRFADNPGRQFTSSGEILPFGAGPHHCTGSRLGEVEMVHAFDKLFNRVARMTPARDLPPSQGFILHSPPELPVVLEPRI
jgi:cytochrome P450